MSYYIAANTDGCNFAERCVECPFAKCRFDYEITGLARELVPALVAEMARDGYSVPQIIEAIQGRPVANWEVEMWVRAG